jgi:hypothetical protein
MGMVNGIRALNALTSGTMTGAQLTAYLASGSNLGSFKQLFNLRGQINILAESSVAMTAVAASSVAMTAVAASSVAMTAVAASSVAMTAVAASSVAKMAVFNNDIALNAIAASATAMAAMRASAGYIVTNPATMNGLAVTLAPLNAAGSYIVLGYSKSVATTDTISLLSTRRAGSTIATSIGPITNASSTLGADAYMALPVVAPFTATGNNRIWYFGMLRCDV